MNKVVESLENVEKIQPHNPVTYRGFVTTPRPLLYDVKGLSRDAKLLYIILLGYAWQDNSCFPGYGRLMQDMECNRNSLARYIRELKSFGLLESVP